METKNRQKFTDEEINELVDKVNDSDNKVDALKALSDGELQVLIDAGKVRTGLYYWSNGWTSYEVDVPVTLDEVKDFLNGCYDTSWVEDFLHEAHDDEAYNEVAEDHMIELRFDGSPIAEAHPEPFRWERETEEKEID